MSKISAEKFSQLLKPFQIISVNIEQAIDKVAQYSIKELEKLTGVKAHTIRIWEQRYQIVDPHRTETNIRFYDDEHLKKLLNVSVLLSNGYKISKISKLDPDTLQKELFLCYKRSTSKAEAVDEDMVKSLIVSMIEYNERSFNELFVSAVTAYGMEGAFVQVIYPFLHKVGVMWGMNELNPAQEHFISALLRQKVHCQIDALPIPEKPNKTFILFLGEGEFHELGLMLANYIIKRAGSAVFYLGQNLPLNDLKDVAGVVHPDYLLTFFTGVQSQDSIHNNLKRIESLLPETPVLFATNLMIDENMLSKNARLLHGIEALNDYL